MRSLTKMALGMAATYMLLNRPKRNFAEINEELARIPALLLRKTLSLTFLGFVFTLLIVGGIIMLFYDIGFYYSLHKSVGISSVGISSLILVMISAGTIFFLVKPKSPSAA